MIISCQNVKKYYGANLVLSQCTFEINPGERVGIIGRNGAGKSTLLKMMTGELSVDGGEIYVRKGTKIGSLAQIPDYQDETTVFDVLARGYQEVLKCQEQMNRLETHMSDPDVYGDEAKLAQAMQEYEKNREFFEINGGYEMHSYIERIANGIGIPKEQYERSFASLSGGEKTKIGLATLLIEQPDLLFLDEPTNHLDMNAVEWLETFLTTYQATVVVISHDRYFLDKVIQKVIEIEDGEAVVYHTNYTQYQKEKEERLMQEFADFQEQQKKIKKMQESIKQLIEWGNRGKPPNPSFHRRAASMQKALDRMEKLKRPVLERKSIDLQIQQNDRSGKEVALFRNVTKQYGDRILFSDVSELLVYGERVFLIGDNGVGKSTLIKLLLGQEEPSAGELRLGARVETGYLAQEAAPHDDDRTVLQYFRDYVAMEEGVSRGQLARFLFFGPDVFKAVRNLSGGEWTRLRLALLTYQNPNLLVLDEPTNHLDIDSREALEEALDDFPGTLLVISHDRYFINKLAHKIWNLRDGQLTSYLGDFEYYKEKIREWQKQQEEQELRAAQEQKEREKKQKQQKVQAEKPADSKKDKQSYSQEKLEKQIEEWEEKLQALDAEIASPAMQEDYERLHQLYESRQLLDEQLAALYERWMDK